MKQLNQEGKYTALAVNIQAAASGGDPALAMMIAASVIINQARRRLPETEWPRNVKNLNQEAFFQDQLQECLGRRAEMNPKPIALFVETNLIMSNHNRKMNIRKKLTGAK